MQFKICIRLIWLKIFEIYNKKIKAIRSRKIIITQSKMIRVQRKFFHYVENDGYSGKVNSINSRFEYVSPWELLLYRETRKKLVKILWGYRNTFRTYIRATISVILREPRIWWIHANTVEDARKIWKFVSTCVSKYREYFPLAFEYFIISNFYLPSWNTTKNASPNNTLSYAKMYKDARLDIFPPRVSLFFPLFFFENLLLL